MPLSLVSMVASLAALCALFSLGLFLLFSFLTIFLSVVASGRVLLRDFTTIPSPKQSQSQGESRCQDGEVCIIDRALGSLPLMLPLTAVPLGELGKMALALGIIESE